MIVCPNCGEENPERARFCLSCGESLEAEVPAGEERKVVSVLFVDLVGFTDRSDRADPEDVRATLRPYHERVKADIESFGGTVEKFIGDAVMAVFGAPTAHEDDAERAVRAALRILETIEELRGEGLDVAVRAAVTTGEAVVALGARPERGEGIVAGDVVNTAARLQGAAPVGGVIVDGATMRSAERRDRLRAARAGRGEGEAGADPGLASVEARSRFGVDTELRAQTLVRRARLRARAARRDVLARAARAVRAARHGRRRARRREEPPRRGSSASEIDRRPDLVALAPGTLPALRRGHHVLGARRDREGPGRHPRVGRPPTRRAAKLGATVAELVADESERAWFGSRLAPLVGARTRSPRRRPRGGVHRLAAVPRGARRAAADRPRVRGSPLGRRRAARLPRAPLDWTADVPLLVVGTARPELFERRPGWGGGKRNATTLVLSPLSDEETARLVSGSARAVGPAGRDAGGSARASGRKSALRRAVRRACSSERGDGDGTRRSRRPCRRSSPRGSTRFDRAQERCLQDASVAREGVLDRRGRGDGRSRSRRGAGASCASSSGASSCARRSRRCAARTSSPSGTPSSATSPTSRSRVRRGQTSTLRRRLDRAERRRARRGPRGVPRSPLRPGAGASSRSAGDAATRELEERLARLLRARGRSCDEPRHAGGRGAAYRRALELSPDDAERGTVLVEARRRIVSREATSARE